MIWVLDCYKKKFINKNIIMITRRIINAAKLKLRYLMKYKCVNNTF